MLARAPLLASVALLALAPALARADYVSPKKSDGDDETTGEDGMPVKKRRIFVVEEEVAAPPEKHFTVSWNPLALLSPLAEFSVEARLASDLSIALLGGYGKVDVNGADTYTGPSKVAAWEAGAQLLWYAQGEFSSGGIQVGGDFRFVHATVEGPASSSGTTAAGFTAGPIVGWKWVVKAGFTIDSMIGVGVIVKHQKADDGAPKDDRAAVLNAALNLGWTF